MSRVWVTLKPPLLCTVTAVVNGVRLLPVVTAPELSLRPMVMREKPAAAMAVGVGEDQAAGRGAAPQDDGATGGQGLEDQVSPVPGDAAGRAQVDAVAGQGQVAGVGRQGAACARQEWARSMAATSALAVPYRSAREWQHPRL